MGIRLGLWACMVWYRCIVVVWVKSSLVWCGWVFGGHVCWIVICMIVRLGVVWVRCSVGKAGILSVGGDGPFRSIRAVLVFCPLSGCGSFVSLLPSPSMSMFSSLSFRVLLAASLFSGLPLLFAWWAVCRLSSSYLASTITSYHIFLVSDFAPPRLVFVLSESWLLVAS